MATVVMLYNGTFEPLFFDEYFKSKNDSAFKLRSAEVIAKRASNTSLIVNGKATSIFDNKQIEKS